MCTKFGVDDSCLFPFRVRTHRHKHRVTDATDLPTHNSDTAGTGNYNHIHESFSKHNLRWSTRQNRWQQLTSIPDEAWTACACAAPHVSVARVHRQQTPEMQRQTTSQN